MNSLIAHIDADCFFAALEMRDRPWMKPLPVAVGGERGGRGVIATCNYLARDYGIRSAMPSVLAKQLCPTLLLVPPRFEVYRETSKQMMAIFAKHTPNIEVISIDEAYIDLSEACSNTDSAVELLYQIKEEIREQFDITISAGIAPNKFLAKIASDWNKPDGMFALRPDEVEEFLASLPVSKIHGVGKVTQSRLRSMGISTCYHLQHFPENELETLFGEQGRLLSQRAKGIDTRRVTQERIRKSVSVEHTFTEDIPQSENLTQHVNKLLDQLEERFHKLADHYQPSKLMVKVKFADFDQTTAEAAIPVGNSTFETEPYLDLLQSALTRRNQPIRLLGLGMKLEPFELTAETRAEKPLEEPSDNPQNDQMNLFLSPNREHTS